jgi:nicotinamide-nucleotide amidase
MRAEIIAIGSELLTPYKADTNSLYLTEKLLELGIKTDYKTIVGDSRETLYKAIKDASKRVQLIITTGGLGPTEDDITREVVANFLKKELILHEDIVSEIKNHFSFRKLKMPDINIRQAFVIAGAEVFKNSVGTAPGQWYEDENIKIAILPGPPAEMKPMVENFLMKKLEGYSSFFYAFKSMRIVGLTESAVEEKIEDIISGLKNPWINILAIPGQIEINIMARGKESKDEAKEKIEPVFKNLKKRLKEYIYAEDKIDFEKIIGDMLKKSKRNIAVAESCTGGLLANRITNIAGSSKYFDRGVVSYSNKAKTDVLKVKKETIKKHGAVSEETAREMAEGIRKLSDTYYGIGITGIAGPSGGTMEKPVGLVYIAISTPEKTEVFRYRFIGGREKIKWQSSQQALYHLWKDLKGDE